MRRIEIDCLKCGHVSSLSEAALQDYGFKPDTSLVILTKKFVCQECGSKAVRAYRYEDEAPPLAPRTG